MHIIRKVKKESRNDGTILILTSNFLNTFCSLLGLLKFINLCALISLSFDNFLDDKSGSTENKNSKDEASKATLWLGVGVGFLANPSDFSAMSGLLNLSGYFLSSVNFFICVVFVIFIDIKLRYFLISWV